MLLLFILLLSIVIRYISVLKAIVVWMLFLNRFSVERAIFLLKAQLNVRFVHKVHTIILPTVDVWRAPPGIIAVILLVGSNFVAVAFIPEKVKILVAQNVQVIYYV